MLRRSFGWLGICCLFMSSHAAGSGLLVPRDGSAPIQMQSHRVSASLEDGLALTTVRQTFVNPHGRPLEAIYLFPLPEGAALVDLAMEVGGQRLEGFLAERKTAKRSYQTIKRRGLDPALVEQVGRSKFRLSVFPVMPNEPTVIELTWIESVPLVQGQYTYVYPLALEGAATQTERDLTLNLSIRSSATIESIASTTQGVVASKRSDHEGSASMEKMKSLLNEDIVVTTKVKTQDPTLRVHMYHPFQGEPYFAAVLTPPELNEEQVIPRDITLVLDVSGSMEGIKFEQARSAGLWLIDHLRDKDRINVLLFNNDVRSFAEEPVLATMKNRADVREFLEGAAAGGGTALGDAIARGCRTPKREGRSSLVVVLTDGLPTIGESQPDKIIDFAKRGSERGLQVFTFGVGQDVDASLLEGVATGGGGQAQVFRQGGEIESRLRRFLSRTSSPAIVDLRVTLGDRTVDDLMPRPLEDIYLGEQATLTGRALGKGEKEFVITGVFKGKEVSWRQTVNLEGRFDDGPKNPTALYLYAQAKLGFLNQALRLRDGLNDAAYFAALDKGAYSTQDELVRAIIDMSLETGVQSAYTSFLALLPEDHVHLNPRDAKALDEAMEKAEKRRRDIAGPLIADASDFIGEVEAEKAKSKRYRGPGDTVPSGAGTRPPGNPGGPGSPGPGAPATGGRPGFGTTGGPQFPGGRSGGSRPTTAGFAQRQTGASFDDWEFWWGHNHDIYTYPSPTISGTAGLATGRGQRRALSTTPVSQSDVETRLLPVWLHLLEHETNHDILDCTLIAIARSLPSSKADLAFEPIVAQLSNPQDSIKQSAIIALGILGSERARPILLEVMNSSEEGQRLLGLKGITEVPVYCSAYAAIALGFIGNPSDIKSLRAVIDDPTLSIQKDLESCAIIALGMFSKQADQIVPYLLEVMEHPGMDPKVQSLAPIALHRLGKEAQQAVPTLHAKVKNKATDINMVRSCVIALGILATMDQDEILETLYSLADHHHDGQTRGFATNALGVIASRDQGVDFVQDPDHKKLQVFLKSGINSRLPGQESWAASALAGYAKSTQDTKLIEDAIQILMQAHGRTSNLAHKASFAIGLGRLGAGIAGKMLHQEFQSTTNQTYAGQLALALGMMQHVEAADDIREMISRKGIEFQLRINLARSLRLMADSEACDTLAEVLRVSKTLSETAACAQALGLLGGSNAIDPILEILNDDQARDLTRAFAAYGLGLLAEKTQFPWNAPLKIGNNYRSNSDALSELLDIL